MGRTLIPREYGLVVISTANWLVVDKKWWRNLALRRPILASFFLFLHVLVLGCMEGGSLRFWMTDDAR